MSLIVPGLGEWGAHAASTPHDAASDFVPSSLASLTLMGADGDPVSVELGFLGSLSDLTTLAPMRAPMPYHGQLHLPSYYFSVTQGQHVYAESRLEESWLLILDWATTVRAVASQPLTVVAADEAGETATHTPDFLVVTAGVPVLANVRPARLTDRPPFVRGQAVTVWLAERLGWGTAVLTEPPPLLVRNLRWLRNFARPTWGVEKIREDVVDLVSTGVASTIGEVIAARDDRTLTTPAVMHLLWHHRLETSLHCPINFDSHLFVAAVDDD